jgi:hypothetical protein
VGLGRVERILRKRLWDCENREKEEEDMELFRGANECMIV